MSQSYFSGYIVCFFQLQYVLSQYTPTWESLSSRPLPLWYDEAKFGIFIHWGVYSVPSFESEWFWELWKGNKNSIASFMKNYPSNFTYKDFAPRFTTEFYDPLAWAKMFRESGAKYVVLTSKHHEGFTLWPSEYSLGWNSMSVGPHRDLLGELADALCTNTELKFGVYYSLYEWFHPLYLHDKENNFSTQLFISKKVIPELHQLVMKYRPAIIWADGDWEARDCYWCSKEFLAWLYNESPVKEYVVVNDRWGIDIPCHHGDFYTCRDHFNPRILQHHKWENCMTVDKRSWGYRRNAQLCDYKNTQEILQELVETVSCGGNLLLNVGPTKDGMIPVIMEERLHDVGSWLTINGEAIYSTKPWTTQNDSYTKGVWYTTSGDQDKQIVYAIVFDWPENGLLTLGSPKLRDNSIILMLGTSCILNWKETQNGIEISFPEKSMAPKRMTTLKMSSVQDKHPCRCNS